MSAVKLSVLPWTHGIRDEGTKTEGWDYAPASASKAGTRGPAKLRVEYRGDVGSEVLPGPVMRVVSAFLRRHLDLESPEIARNQCRILSEELAEGFADAGIPAECVWVAIHAQREVAVLARGVCEHCIVQVEGFFVDVTRAQFESGCSVPCVYPSEATLARDWLYVSRDNRGTYKRIAA